MIIEKQYRDFSWDLHARVGHKPIVCQLELSFRCPLSCVHCYTNCYNNAESARGELGASRIKEILDKIYSEGCFWLCLTGGDPLIRDDFEEIYLYAKKKGFLITIFTSAVLIEKKIIGILKKYPPFSIEVTLNGSDQETYEKISRTRNSFKKAINGIRLIRENGLPLKMKTLINRLNKDKMEEIRSFIEGLGMEFRPNCAIYPAINGDTSVCAYRLSPEEVIRHELGDSLSCDGDGAKGNIDEEKLFNIPPPPRLFRCAAGGFSFHIDPYGKMFLCNFLRDPSYDMVTGSMREGFYYLNNIVRAKVFKTDSKCRDCKIWSLCHTCPGRAFLETGDEEAPIEYFCTLASLKAKELACRVAAKRS